MDTKPVSLRPVVAQDLDVLRRFRLEPGMIGPNWYGHQDSGELERRFHKDGWLGPEDSRLMVYTGDDAAGFVAWFSTTRANGRYWSFGIALLSEWRGKGIGLIAQRLLCKYLLEHTPVERLEATTQPENVAEQRILTQLGFTHEGTLRKAEFRRGEWRDMLIYGLLRNELK